MWSKHNAVIERNGDVLYIHLGWYQLKSLFIKKFARNWDFTIFNFKVGRSQKRLELDLGFLGFTLFVNVKVPFLAGKTDEEYQKFFDELVKRTED